MNMRIWVIALLAVAMMAAQGCGTTGGGVIEKVKYDFGIGEKPEGYVSGSDKVMSSLRQVGATEMKRLNQANRHGDVKFESDGALQGKYFKEAKVYESFHPIDSNATSGGGGEMGMGYRGTVDYTYRILRSAPFPTRTEAEAASASLPTDVTGRESYRYRFSGSGVWDGQEGEKTR